MKSLLSLLVSDIVPLTGIALVIGAVLGMGVVLVKSQPAAAKAHKERQVKLEGLKW